MQPIARKTVARVHTKVRCCTLSPAPGNNAGSACRLRICPELPADPAHNYIQLFAAGHTYAEHVSTCPRVCLYLRFMCIWIHTALQSQLSFPIQSLTNFHIEGLHKLPYRRRCKAIEDLRESPMNPRQGLSEIHTEDLQDSLGNSSQTPHR